MDISDGPHTHTEVKKHHWHIWLEPNKLAVADHRLYYNQLVQLHDHPPPPPPPQKKLLSTKPHMDQLIRKETEIELNPNSINKKEGLDLNEAM
jgi:hypothetical protein